MLFNRINYSLAIKAGSQPQPCELCGLAESLRHICVLKSIIRKKSKGVVFSLDFHGIESVVCDRLPPQEVPEIDNNGSIAHSRTCTLGCASVASTDPIAYCMSIAYARTRHVSFVDECVNRSISLVSIGDQVLSKNWKLGKCPRCGLWTARGLQPCCVVNVGFKGGAPFDLFVFMVRALYGLWIFDMSRLIVVCFCCWKWIGIWIMYDLPRECIMKFRK